jgi:hypothetical protein
MVRGQLLGTGGLELQPYSKQRLAGISCRIIRYNMGAFRLVGCPYVRGCRVICSWNYWVSKQEIMTEQIIKSIEELIDAQKKLLQNSKMQKLKVKNKPFEKFRQ